MCDYPDEISELIDCFRTLYMARITLEDGTGTRIDQEVSFLGNTET
jgi:hypothetical protein